jgi:HEPN domain-containing protein
MIPEEKQRTAQDYYDFWFDSAQDFFELYTHAVTGKKLKKAAFLLNQCAEAAYKTVLLVFTGYSPRERYLNILGQMAAESDAAMGDIFPRDTREARERLELLNYAYIGARYDSTYWIAEEDLNLLSICVSKLLDRTKQICEAEIERLGPDPK